MYNNEITIEGNVGKDPEVVETSKGTIAKFNVAVKSGDKTEWFRVAAWHDMSRGVEKSIRKGMWVLVKGSYHVTDKKNDDGTWVHYCGITASNIYLIDSKVFPIKKDDNGEEEEDGNIPF